MSITLLGSARADAQWDPDIPQVIPTSIPSTKLEDTERVPTTLPEMMAWAYLKAVKSADPRRTFRLVHRLTASEGTASEREVLIRFQGYILGCDMRPLGSWHGTRRDAPRARQHLTMAAREYPDIMAAQTRVVRHLFDTVQYTLGFTSQFVPPARKISFQHVVFTKTRPTVYTPNVLQAEDDPTGKAAAIASEWVVATKVITQQLTADGTITPYPGALFKKGDFVDVVASVDIVCTQREGGRDIRMYLDMRTVTLLKAAEDGHSHKRRKIHRDQDIDTIDKENSEGSKAYTGLAIN